MDGTAQHQVCRDEFGLCAQDVPELVLPWAAQVALDLGDRDVQALAHFRERAHGYPAHACLPFVPLPLLGLLPSRSVMTSLACRFVKYSTSTP